MIANPGIEVISWESIFVGKEKGGMPGTGIEPVQRDEAPKDFKSFVSTCSTTRAVKQI